MRYVGCPPLTDHLLSLQTLCSAIAVLLHYLFMVMFMWMLMEGVVLYVKLVRVFMVNRTMLEMID